MTFKYDKSESNQGEGQLAYHTSLKSALFNDNYYKRANRNYFKNIK